MKKYFLTHQNQHVGCILYDNVKNNRYFMSSGHKRGASGGGRWPCQRRSLYVKFRDLGWQVNILNGFPRNKQIFYIKILHIKA